MDVKYNVALWPSSHLTIKYEMFMNCVLFQYFQNEMIEDLLFKDWIIVCVFLKGCKMKYTSAIELLFLAVTFHFETHLSTLKLASINGVNKNKISFFLTWDNVV